MTFCELCEIDDSGCVHGNPPKPEPVLEATGQPMVSTFTTRCPSCGETVIEHEHMIVPTDDGWAHAECTDYQPMNMSGVEPR